MVRVNRNAIICKKNPPYIKTVLSSTGIVTWSAISTFHTVQTAKFTAMNYVPITISAGARTSRGCGCEGRGCEEKRV